MMDVHTYEGFCQFCKREIGTGHERHCPYWHPKPCKPDPPKPQPTDEGQPE